MLTTSFSLAYEGIVWDSSFSARLNRVGLPSRDDGQLPYRVFWANLSSLNGLPLNCY